MRFQKGENVRNEQFIFVAHQNEDPSDLAPKLESEQSQLFHRKRKSQIDSERPKNRHCANG